MEVFNLKDPRCFHAKRTSESPQKDMSDKVVGIVTTCDRAGLVRRLLDSLISEKPELAYVVVNDNGGRDETATFVQHHSVGARHLQSGRNLGCGGGIEFALREALKDTDATHFWILDDDTVVSPGCLAALLAAMRDHDAGLSSPMITAADGAVGWFPGLQEKEAWSVIKSKKIKPSEYLKACGDRPVEFSWCPWNCLLVRRDVVEQLGFPRGDFWFMVEDLEYSLRLTSSFRGVFTPRSVIQHLPPQANPSSGRKFLLKQALYVQNLTYTALRVRHGRRLARHLPGNYFRFFRDCGVGLSSIALFVKALWLGGIRGLAGGMGGGDGFRQMYLRE